MEVCEIWEAVKTFDLLSEESEVLSAFTESQAADAAVIRRLLERCSACQPGSTAARVTEDLYAELAALVERNKELRNTLSEMADRVQKSQQTVQTYEQDRKLLAQEVKETYEAFVMTKMYYKKNLRFYYTIESSNNDDRIILVQFFTERRNDNQQYSVMINRNIKTGKNEIVEMHPMLASFKSMKNRLAETNDILGALCCIRQSFLQIRQNKGK